MTKLTFAHLQQNRRIKQVLTSNLTSLRSRCAVYAMSIEVHSKGRLGIPVMLNQSLQEDETITKAISASIYQVQDETNLCQEVDCNEAKMMSIDVHSKSRRQISTM